MMVKNHELILCLGTFKVIQLRMQHIADVEIVVRKAKCHTTAKRVGLL